MGGSEALWGRALPQKGKMMFGSCAGEVAFPPSHNQSNIYLQLEYIFKKPFQCLDFCIRAYLSSTSTTKLITCKERTENLEK